MKKSKIEKAREKYMNRIVCPYVGTADNIGWEHIRTWISDAFNKGAAAQKRIDEAELKKGSK